MIRPNNRRRLDIQADRWRWMNNRRMASSRRGLVVSSIYFYIAIAMAVDGKDMDDVNREVYLY